MIAYRCMYCRKALHRVEFERKTEGRTDISDGACLRCSAVELAKLPSPPPGVALRMVEEAERE